MEKTKKEPRLSNFETAQYIAESQGYDVPDEKIIKVAKALNMRPTILIKNYKTVVDMNRIFEGLMPLDQKN